MDICTKKPSNYAIENYWFGVFTPLGGRAGFCLMEMQRHLKLAALVVEMNGLAEDGTSAEVASVP